MSHVDDGTLHAYLDGELSPAEAQGVEAHLAQCRGCRGRLEEERALTTRAAELLALAAPPDREVPPFRAGDVKPPARLWWQVRQPLAWAATIVLALGIGTYLGRGGEAIPDAKTASDTQPSGYGALKAPISPDVAQRESRVKARGAPRTPPAAPPAAPAPAARQEADAFARERKAQVAAIPRDTALSAATSAPAPQAGIAIFVDGHSVPKGSPISVDSARALLGADPLAVPGAPIRTIYQAREIGYSAVVIVEQALDSSTVIELVERRAAPLNLEAVVVTAAGETRAPDSVARLKEERRKAEPRADAPAAKLNARVAPLDAQSPPRRRLGNLEIHISGPLPSDSLQKLLRLVQPLKP
jgi:hypothetical protein